MSITGWQSNLRRPDGTVVPPGQVITAPNGPDYKTVGALASVLGLVALGILAPEALLAIGADVAGTGATATAGTEAPAWAYYALENPSGYSKDTLDLARSLIPKSAPPPFYDMPPGELPF